MKLSSISNTKNHLSSLLEEVRRGETVIITDHHLPIARLERVEVSWDEEGLSSLVQTGILRPPLETPDSRKILDLPRGVAPAAQLNEAVAEDRDTR